MVQDGLKKRGGILQGVKNEKKNIWLYITNNILL